MVTLNASDFVGLPVLVYAANLAVASILVGAATLLAYRRSRGASLPLAHAILLCGIAVVVVGPLAVGLIQLAGCSPLGIAMEAQGLSNSFASEIARTPTPDGHRPLPQATQRPPDGARRATGAPQHDGANRSAATAAHDERRTVDARPWSTAFAWVAMGLIVAWLAGSCYQLFRLLQGIRRVRKLLSMARPVDDARICAIAQWAARSLGLAGCPALCQSPILAAPVSTGVFHPRVVLPQGSDCDWSDEQWKYLLVHEMAHVGRRDLVVGWLQRVARVVYWWNPLVRRMSDAVSMVREQICDDLVTEHAAGGNGYAALIVELASRLVERRIAAPVLGMTDGSAGELAQRVLRVMDAKRPLITSAGRRTIVLGAAFALTLLASLVGTGVHLATARASEADEQDKDSTAKPAENSAWEMKKTVRVVDAADKPIAGATVVPWAMRANRGHGSWKPNGYGESEPPTLTTDADGKATIPFPRYSQKVEKIPPQQLTCRVSHPGYAETMYNEVQVSDDELDNVATIVLHEGAQIEITALAGGQALPMDQVVAHWTSPSGVGYKAAKVNKEGRLQLPRLPAGTELVRFSYFPVNGPSMFSDVEQLELADGDRRELRVELKPTVRAEGRLDESVPRPVKNGRVVAAVIERVDKGHSMEWRVWSPIQDDGSFAFEALPHGDLQVTALCDGFVAEDGSPPESATEQDRLVAGSFGLPQVFPLTGETTRFTLMMTPTAECLFHVVDPDGRPVAGAQVHCWPNVKWWGGGSQIYCHPLVGSHEALTDPKVWRERAMQDRPYAATTDADGKAVIKNLPADVNSFAVDHSKFELPIGEGNRRSGRLALIAGQQTEVQVTLQPKGTQLLGTDAPTK